MGIEHHKKGTISVSLWHEWWT